MVLSEGVKSRGIHDLLPPKSLCTLMEKGKGNKRFSGRRGSDM